MSERREQPQDIFKRVWIERQPGFSALNALDFIDLQRGKSVPDRLEDWGKLLACPRFQGAADAESFTRCGIAATGVLPDGKRLATLADFIQHLLHIWANWSDELEDGMDARELVFSTVNDVLTKLYREAEDGADKALENAVAIVPEQGRVVKAQAVVVFDEKGGQYEYVVLSPQAFHGQRKIILDAENTFTTEDGTLVSQARFGDLFHGDGQNSKLVPTQKGESYILWHWHGVSSLTQRDPDKAALLSTLEYPKQYILFCPLKDCPAEVMSKTRSELPFLPTTAD